MPDSENVPECQKTAWDREDSDLSTRPDSTNSFEREYTFEELSPTPDEDKENIHNNQADQGVFMTESTMVGNQNKGTLIEKTPNEGDIEKIQIELKKKATTTAKIQSVKNEVDHTERKRNPRSGFQSEWEVDEIYNQKNAKETNLSKNGMGTSNPGGKSGPTAQSRTGPKSDVSKTLPPKQEPWKITSENNMSKPVPMKRMPVIKQLARNVKQIIKTNIAPKEDDPNYTTKDGNGTSQSKEVPPPNKPENGKESDCLNHTMWNINASHEEKHGPANSTDENVYQAADNKETSGNIIIQPKQDHKDEQSNVNRQESIQDEVKNESTQDDVYGTKEDEINGEKYCNGDKSTAEEDEDAPADSHKPNETVWVNSILVSEATPMPEQEESNVAHKESPSRKLSISNGSESAKSNAGSPTPNNNQSNGRDTPLNIGGIIEATNYGSWHLPRPIGRHQSIPRQPAAMDNTGINLAWSASGVKLSQSSSKPGPVQKQSVWQSTSKLGKPGATNYRSSADGDTAAMVTHSQPELAGINPQAGPSIGGFGSGMDFSGTITNLARNMRPNTRESSFNYEFQRLDQGGLRHTYPGYRVRKPYHAYRR